MARDVIMPALGMAQDTGLIVAWLRAEGDAVIEGDVLLEVETDKAVVPIEAPVSGTVGPIGFPEGTVVAVGTTITVILAAGEVASPPTPAPAPSPTPATAPTARLLASPKARRLAAERGVSLVGILGSGPAGAVRADDVPSPTAAPPIARDTPGYGRTWSVMARRMVESWTTAPHFSLERDVRADRVAALVAAVRARSGVRVTISDVLVRLVAFAITEHPDVNVAWDGTAPAASATINIGLAAALPDGLVVPVIHEADRLDLVGIAARRTTLVAAARAGRLAPADLANGTFTITNLGMFGVDRFSAILNPPQAAILAVGRIGDRVVARDGQVVVAPTMTLTLTCDHRALDGARAAAFLTTLADLIEEPALLAERPMPHQPTTEVSDAQ